MNEFGNQKAFRLTLMTYRKRVYTELLGMLALQVPGLPPVGAGCKSSTHKSGCSCNCEAASEANAFA